MGIELRPARLRAGNVSFNVKAIPRIPFTRSLPTRASYFLALMLGAGVDEDKAGDKGEVSELDPGKSGSLTVDLKAGRYLLICNVLGHYGTDVRPEFTVDP